MFLVHIIGETTLHTPHYCHYWEDNGNQSGVNEGMASRTVYIRHLFMAANKENAITDASFNVILTSIPAEARIFPAVGPEQL
jgi:hypothetical protein